jgi:hypothetical protein
MHADRTNRFALTLFGLLVLLIGAAGLAASVGAFGHSFSHRTLFANRVSTYIGDHGEWVWPAAAGVSLVIALLALRWILALVISTDRAGDIPIPVAMSDGTTVLQPAAIIGALTREVSTYHGVDNTHGRIIGDGAAPELILEVTARQSADLHVLYQRIEAEAFAHARQALDKESLPIKLDLDVSRRNT